MESINKKLESLVNNEKTGSSFQNYSLESIKQLLKLFGNPHKKIKTIHIAGTNGKGSVAHMLNSIMIASGLRTGLYTSPHLIRINERILLNNREIPNSRFMKYTDELEKTLKKNPELSPTYFDALTLFALRYFHEENAGIAIIEAGLGGRLDSTNVIMPEISIITDVSLDHMHILGDTVQKIASEKAGIIKKGSIVVTSNRDEKILEILCNKSYELKTDIYVFSRDFFAKNIHKNNKTDNRITGFDFLLNLKEGFLTRQSKGKKTIQNYFSLRNIKIQSPGKFQIRNSSLAIAASLLIEKSGIKLDENDIIKGLGNSRVPGRLQVLSKDPLIIFDPAHNPAALKATLTAVSELYPHKKYNALLSFMIDKDYSSMFKIVRKLLGGKIFYYELNDARCYKPSQEKTGKKKTIFDNVITISDFKALFDSVIKSLKPDSLLLVTGSFRLFTIAQKLGKSFGQ